MNILEALVKLRDDLKLWVTNNLQALKNEIDNKSEFSGDYQDLANKPDIDGKIETAVNPLTSSIGLLQEKDNELQDNIDELNNDIDGVTNTVDTHTANEEIHTTQEEKDAWNEHTENADIHVTAESKLRWDNKSDFSGSYNDLLDAPDIVDDNTGVLKFVDNNKNIIMQVGADGVHTTSIILDDEVIANKATLDSLDVSTIQLNGNDLATMMDTKVNSKFEELVDSAPGSLDTLNELAAALGDDPNFSVTVLGKIASKADASELGKYALKTDISTVTNDLTNELMTKYNNAYNHSQSEHAPVDAQKNSDITKAEIEAKLTGTVTSHNHDGVYAPINHGTHLTLGETSSNAYRGDRGKTAYDHSQTAHAPSNAQKNSDITKAEIEAKLTGTITSHNHDDIYAPVEHGTHLTIGTGASNAAAGNHTHNYAGSSSAGGAANSVKTNLVVKLNGGSTEGADLFTFNGSTAKTIDITPSSIGAAASSHGTHLTLGTTSSTAYRGDYGNTAYTHSQAAHAPSNAQKNSDITKAEIEAKLTGTITSHTHNYAGSSSAGGAANSVKTNLIIKLNGGTTEGTNLFTFNGSTAKTIDITPSSIGAAASSHGTHVTWATSAPKANGTAAVGTVARVAREDHVHPLQTTMNGYSLWSGTKAEYDAITSKSSTTLYFIKE